MIIEGAIIVGAALLGLSPTMIFTVDQNEETVLTSFGKHTGTRKKSGINFKLPWQKKEKVVSKKVNETMDKIKTKTSDNIFVTVPVTMHLQVVDSAKSVFVGEDPVALSKSTITNAMKETISKSTLDQLFSERQSIRDQIQDQVKDDLAEYGYSLKEVIIDEPQVPASVEERYNNAKSSEQELIERTNLAEAAKRERIFDAEAQKEATRLLGEGIAEQREAIMSKYADQIDQLTKKGMDIDDANKILILAMEQDTLRDIGQHGNMIISTTNSEDLLTKFQSLGKTLTNKSDNDNSAPGLQSPQAGVKKQDTPKGPKK